MTAPVEDTSAAAAVPPGVVVALDVGGTSIKSAIVDRTGTVRYTERHATGAQDGPDAVLETIVGVADSLRELAETEGASVLAVGVAVPGVVDEANGVAVWSANVGFRDVPLRSILEKRLGLPAALGHDVRAGGLAEARLGAARDFRHVLVVPIGTGIAAAHVVDGVVSTGAHGAAGEIGHVVVRPGGPECGCGGRGCLEAIASASAIGRHYTAATGQAANAQQVLAGVAAGDPAAAGVWRDAIDALADGLLTGLALFDPEIVVLGGGLAQAGDRLLVPLRTALQSRLTFHREPVLCRAALGDQAGCLGAALLALDGVPQ